MSVTNENPYDLAEKLAQTNGWTVIPSAVHCLNLLGLSTQVPARIVYTSTGPDCECNVAGFTVRFEHSSEAYLTALHGRARLLIHALNSLRGFDVTEEWARAQALLTEDEKQHLRENLTCVPTWLHPLVANEGENAI